MHWFFGFFLVSGFCSLVYQVVWLRLAMASYGVTTPVVSLVLSLFMAGLGLGSWLAGRWTRRFEVASGGRLLRVYALAEVLIGASALVAPWTMTAGRELLQGLDVGMGLGSSGYYLAAAPLLALAIFPWCVCMGATFPLAMAAIQRGMRERSADSFSYLYVANVLGALFGTLVSAFVLIELLGFRATLWVAMGLNWALALVAFAVSGTRAMRRVEPRSRTVSAARLAAQEGSVPTSGRLMLALLFATGLCSMAMEVIWVRQFTPYVSTVVYAFALIIGIYLVATFLGSKLYRLWAATRETRVLGLGWILVGLFALVPLLAADYRWSPEEWAGLAWFTELDRKVPMDQKILRGTARVVLGIGPFCMALGFLTPMLVDRWSRGDPDRAGRAYAVNVLGSLLGPLVAGFVLLPLFGERSSLVLLTLPLFAAGTLATVRGGGLPKVTWIASVALAVGCVLGSRAYQDQFPVREVRHDATATVIAAGEGMERRLLVNGVGITELTPMTKMMAHMPLVWRTTPAENALVICFGMGTSFRSLESWGIETVGVELVPSIPGLFSYFHEDAEEILARPGNRVVVDDGRRFLERTDEVFDVITIDPPPPPETAGSSLLYSVEFIALLKERLSPDGVLQHWCPSDEAVLELAIYKALEQYFENVLVFRGMDAWGFHYLASDEPLPLLSARELADRMPPKAAADLIEWGPTNSPEKQFQLLLDHAMPEGLMEKFLDGYHVETIHDDRPLNEYFLLRRMFDPIPRAL